MPGCPSLDMGKPRGRGRVRTTNLPRRAPGGTPTTVRGCDEFVPVRIHIQGGMAQWLEREFTDQKVRGSNPTSAPRLPLSRLGQPGSIPALVHPSGGMVVRRR
ncbi:hypothetical protein CSKR_114306 [Clonorchis sinensis]|uniref:Uncharacterized protein n=1 Tax=Clonorchis sinensis TaxID=79923 RepID=A0A3R7GPD4_CLOSI|nr:hypothetical protein CSKR_114306 [Clonorchis sinensis]